MNELSLFSGAGGGLLGTKWLLGWRTIGYVEIEPYCQEILKARIADGYLDAAPIFGDIRAFIADGYADAYRGMVDVVTGGFPCQDISVCKKTRRAFSGAARRYGGKWPKQFASLDPDTSSWRTRQPLLFADWEKSLEIWPRWGAMRDGACWEVRPPIVAVRAKDYGLSLLRPTAQCWKAWTFLRISSLVRKNHADGNVQEQSARCFNRMITPLSNEILMQWPQQWTDLKPLEMDRFQEWLNEHGRF